MYEFHAWATIRNLTESTADMELETTVAKIKKYMTRFKWDDSILDIRATNGEFHLFASGFNGKKGREAVELMELYEFIAHIAPKSYGLIYILDDEEAGDQNNKFRVFVLQNGVIEEKEDHFLSPFRPVVEDEFKFNK